MCYSHGRKTIVTGEKVRQPGSRRVYDGNSRGHVKNGAEVRVNRNIRGETVVTCRVYTRSLGTGRRGGEGGGGERTRWYYDTLLKANPCERTRMPLSLDAYHPPSRLVILSLTHLRISYLTYLKIAGRTGNYDQFFFFFYMVIAIFYFIRSSVR